MDLKRLAPPAGSRMVVAGGSGGIGRALVDAALDNELRVAVLDEPRALDEYPPPTDAETWPLELTREEEVGRAFAGLEARWGGIDCIANLAGTASHPQVPVERLSPHSWGEVLDGCLGSTLLCCQAAVPLIRRVGGGSIVNLTSDLAYLGSAGYAAYAAARAGIASLTRTLAAELAPQIRVNAVAPGAAATALAPERRPETAASRRAGADEYVGGIPLGRLATPDDVVGPILFLVSDAARYVTGQILHLNGGGLMR